jgi:hypothetical protein
MFAKKMFERMLSAQHNERQFQKVERKQKVNVKDERKPVG